MDAAVHAPHLKTRLSVLCKSSPPIHTSAVKEEFLVDIKAVTHEKRHWSCMRTCRGGAIPASAVRELLSETREEALELYENMWRWCYLGCDYNYLRASSGAWSGWTWAKRAAPLPLQPCNGGEFNSPQQWQWWPLLCVHGLGELVLLPFSPLGAL